MKENKEIPTPAIGDDRPIQAITISQESVLLLAADYDRLCNEITELRRDLAEAKRDLLRYENSTSERAPAAWIRGHKVGTYIEGVFDYEEEVVTGATKPLGDGWCPLYPLAEVTP